MTPADTPMETAAGILITACKRANHEFDLDSRVLMLQRLQSAVDSGMTPLDAAFAVAMAFLLNPVRDGETLLISP